MRATPENEKESKTLAFLLFAIVITFLVCKMPQGAADIFGYWFDEEDSFFVQVILSPYNFLDVLNSCVNFIYYCVFGKKFRLELVKLFKRNWQSKKGRGNGSDITKRSGSVETCVTVF